MKLVNTEKFIEELEDYAITDADREFCRKVRFAIERTQPVKAIPIDFMDKFKEKRPGFVTTAIGMLKDAWEREEGKNGQVESQHNRCSQRAENVTADRPHVDGVGTAPDRRLRTPEGMQAHSIFCVPETAGRGKGPQGDRVRYAAECIDMLIQVNEPIEDIKEIGERAEAIREYAIIIKSEEINPRIKALTDGCEFMAECVAGCAGEVHRVMQKIMEKVSEMNDTLAEEEKNGR